MLTPEHFSRLIAASVVPVVVISASGLLCLAFYNRLGSIVTRLRLFQRERLAQQELLDQAKQAKDGPSVVRHERMIDLIGEQTDDIIRRARLLRRALLFFLAAIATLIFCSLLSGATILWPGAIYLAVPAFAIGLLLLLGGVACAFLEMQTSLAPIELESQVVALLVP